MLMRDAMRLESAAVTRARMNFRDAGEANGDWTDVAKETNGGGVIK